MKSNKLLNILKHFSIEDWVAFKKYLLSKTSKDSQIFEIYNSLYNLYRKDQLHYEALEKYRVVKFSENSRKTFQNLQSKIVGHCQDYLIWSHIKQNKFRAKMSLLEAFSNKGAFEAANSIAFELKRELETSKFQDLQSVFDLLKINHTLVFNSANKINYNPKNNILHETINSLTELASCYAKFYELEYHTRSNIGLLKDDNSIQQLNIFNQLDGSTVLYRIIKDIFELRIHKNQNSFDRLYFDIINSNFKFSEELKTLIYNYCSQYLYRQVFLGEHSKADKLFQLYNKGMEEKILLDNDKLSDLTYHKIIGFACAIGRTEWATEFCQKWGHLIAENQKKESDLIAAAQIAFAVKEYENCIHILNQLSFKDINKKTRARWLLLCSYFVTESSNI